MTGAGAVARAMPGVVAVTVLVIFANARVSWSVLSVGPAAAPFAMDAFGHLKAVGASAAAQPLLDKAGVEKDEGVTDLGAGFVKAAAKRFFAREPNVRDLA